MTTAQRIDSLLESPVLVFGSPPPRGRDLDLLARPREHEAIAAQLADSGFQQDGRRWARFEACSVDLVELFPASHWRLPDEELDALFEQARPIEGFRMLVRPAPPHALLILARRTVYGDGRLDEKRRARLAEILAEDRGDTWARARAHAGAWGNHLALDFLKAAYGNRLPIGRVARARAITEQLVATGMPRARRHAWRSSARPRRRGAVIAFSGIDGAGKSTHAFALRDTLEKLGVDAAVEWTRLGENTWVWLLANNVKRVLFRRPASTGTSAVDPGTALRSRSRVLTHVWATVIATANALSQGRATRRHLRRGRVVICDRYTLDSAVNLRFRYGESRRFRFQTALVRLFSPRPARSYFLDVDPQAARGRKEDEYGLEQLDRAAALYRAEHERFGAKRLDAGRPKGEVCAEVADEVWRLVR